MSLLLISENLALFVNKVTADDKYSLCNSETLQQPFQMQLSKKQKLFSELLALILKRTSNFEHFEKKTTTLIGYVFLELWAANQVIRSKSLKISVSEERSTGNMLKAPKYCLNLNDGTFIMFFTHSDGIRLGKCLSY